MTHETLISAAALAAATTGAQPGAWLVLDCGFDLGDALAGRGAYEAGHIPGALYVHLEQTLSGAKTGSNGRHPLPERQAFADTMAALGAGDETQIVAYDNAGAMYAARLWWMLRWAGHRAAAVLDGGLAAWRAAGGALKQVPLPRRRRGTFSLRPALATTLGCDDVRANLASGERLVIDARAADRFRGENEALDPIGGHIPGAVNRPFRDNLGTDGRFKTADQLRADFLTITGPRGPESLINQCGSGVTACHNLLAMEVAGLGGAALYPGSWSEWSAQPGAPIATGTAVHDGQPAGKPAGWSP